MTRTEEAQRLVDEGRVGIIGQNDYGTVGYVKGEQDIYTVNVFTNGHYFCECVWGKMHFYSDDLCAHALAVRLAMERGVGDA